MAHTPKRRSKRPPPEPLDWRALANGPALRGLSDVLATPGAVASERAARRLALDREELEETPTVGITTTVGVSSTLNDSLDTRNTNELTHSESAPPETDLRSSFDAKVASWGFPTETPTVAETTTVGEAPTVCDAPTVGVSIDDKTARDRVPRQSRHASSNTPQTPTVVELPTEIYPPTVGVFENTTPSALHAKTLPGELLVSAIQEPTAPRTPTVGVSISTERAVQGPALIFEEHDKPAAQLNQQTPTVGDVNRETVSSPRETTAQLADTAQWTDKTGNRIESARVSRVNIAQESMTIGEERFYQVLWHAKDTDGVLHESPQSKTFRMGYDRLARLVRLDEKSIRQLIPRLAEKKILEVIAEENCSARVGKTYRIFSYEEILDRQRRADMQFVVKRGRAVEFVWPLGSG